MPSPVYDRTSMRKPKLLAWIASTVILIFLLVSGAGAAYNTLSNQHYRRIAGVPGKLYNVSGHAMHLYCTGEGSPTIVLSAGLGDDFTIWGKVQPGLSRQTRVCSYDRAGLGWSEARPGIQDADAISSQLHELMEAAAVRRPFVLVGHSISGLYLRSYASHYPGDLIGLVFVDGSAPDQEDRLPKELAKLQADATPGPWQKLLTTLGLYRLQGTCNSIPPGFEAYRAWIEADSCIPSQMDAVREEYDAWRVSGQETIHAGPFGSLPVLILSRYPDKFLPPSVSAPVAKAADAVWNQLQEEEKGLSSKSRRIIAKDSGHYIQMDRSDLVIQELTSFLIMIRDHQSFPGNQSTTEE